MFSLPEDKKLVLIMVILKYCSEKKNQSIDLWAEMGYIYNGLGVTLKLLEKYEEVKFIPMLFYAYDLSRISCNPQ